MYKRLLISSIAVALLVVPSLPARADGLQVVATFPTTNGKLAIANYTSGTTTVGLIAVTIASQTFSYSFGKDESVPLLKLWDHAQQMTGDSYVAAGSVAETATHALDVLLLAGGPDVRFSIADPVDGLLTLQLPRASYAAFDAALHKVADSTTN